MEEEVSLTFWRYESKLIARLSVPVYTVDQSYGYVSLLLTSKHWPCPKPSSTSSSKSLLCVCNPKHPLHTNQRLSSPIILVVKDVSVSVKEVRKEFPQIVVVRLLKEVQPTHVPQVGGHLFCYIHTGTQTHFTHTHIQRQRTHTCTDSYTETHRKFDQHMLAWAYSICNSCTEILLFL